MELLPLAGRDPAVRELRELLLGAAQAGVDGPLRDAEDLGCFGGLEAVEEDQLNDLPVLVGEQGADPLLQVLAIAGTIEVGFGPGQRRIGRGDAEREGAALPAPE